MKLAVEKRIFARRDLADFIGRTDELSRLFQHARRESGDMGLAILATPRAGVSELLRQVYDVLFADQNEIVPFYFEIKPSDGSAHAAAARFRHEFLMQAVAFRRGDSRIIDAAPDIEELAELALPEDAPWIDRLVEAARRGGPESSPGAYVRTCAAAPLRPVAHSLRTFVMIDGLHSARRLDGGETFLDAVCEAFAAADVPFVFAGHRRDMFGRTSLERMVYDRLSFEATSELVEHLSETTEIAVTEQSRDLIALQLGGEPAHVLDLFASAVAHKLALDSFNAVEEVYTDEIFGGRIARRFDALFEALTAGRMTQALMPLLANAYSDAEGRFDPPQDLGATLEALHRSELVNVSPGSATIDLNDLPLGDYLKARTALLGARAPRAMIVGQSMRENAKRAPELMARHYRRSAATDLRGLFRLFDGREIPRSAMDYGLYQTTVKGAGDDDQLLAAIDASSEKLTLPSIVYTAPTSRYYPPLDDLCDTERSCVAVGFVDATEKQDVTWVAAEIDSKLEATRDLTDFWLDRLEMVAVTCGFSNYRFWLISPEGFNDDALQALSLRHGVGSSRRQTALIARLVGAETPANKQDEFEMVVPMGDDTEMIAARGVEEVAKRHGFSPKAINQIKTAVIEACINAAEHSLSPDRRIHQTVSFDGSGLTIIVANRGLRLDGQTADTKAANQSRRGWGLKLIRGLMDEVSVENTDDGTRIVMTKRLTRSMPGALPA